MNELAQLEQQISEVALEYSDAIRVRVHDMANPGLRERVSTLSMQLKELKKMRADLIKLAEHREQEERLARAKAKTADELESARSKQHKINRLFEALSEITNQFLNLHPGGRDIAPLHVELDRIRARYVNAINEAKGKKDLM